MHRFLLALLFFLPATPALAWNAAGHRLVAVIAWQQLSLASREAVSTALAGHPEHARWAERARSDDGIDIFAEAATWPDDIRNDLRFYDEEREPPTPPLPGLPDTARHKRWHYVDLDAGGQVRDGELDRQIVQLTKILRSGGKKAQISNTLPWLIHLVADLHQPLHAGRHGDEGGNQVAIQNPFNPRLPFTNLHTYWDDLPGPPWLRGQRLEKNAARLIEDFPAPPQGDVRQWRDESHRLLDEVYPTASGSLLPIVDEDFRRRSREIANRRLVDAGYRLGRLLESIFGQRVSRGTP